MKRSKTYLHSSAAQKDRSSWFNQHAAFPMRDASPAVLETFWAAQTVADVSPKHRWECVGPFNFAGRVTSLAIHPDKPQTWYAGSAAGGVWVSDDAGKSWKSSWGAYGNQNIGAIAFSDVYDQKVLLAATGEANMSADTYPGSGVYQSYDDGLTWTPAFGAPDGTVDPIAMSVATFPRRIGCIAAKQNRIAYGSIFLDDTLPAGLFLCDFNSPGGTGFCEFWGQRSYNCHSVVFHPTQDAMIYASIEPDGSMNGIWRSPDFGETWEHLTRGLPSGDQFRRTSLAFAPSDPDVIYAVAAGRSEHVLGVFRSTNGGNTWREILGGRYPRERQMSYNNTIAVHPHKPDCVVWGGMKLYRTEDGGRSWRRITSGQRGKRDYAHNDHHALLWPEDDLIVSGNDGGVSITRDGGRTWQDSSQGMVNTMFYNVDAAPSNGKIFAGGTQDNGTLIAGVSGREGDFVQGITGDGAWIAFDHATASSAFGSATDFQIYHHEPGKPWDHGSWKPIMPKRISTQESSERAFTVLTIEPSTRRGFKRVWAGSDRVWCTENNGKTWKAASRSFDGSPISAIEVSPVRPGLLYVGTTNGGIFRSSDGGSSWTQNLSAIDIPARSITSIACHPKFAETVVVTVASSGVASSGVQLITGKPLPYGHIFQSRDMGNTWKDLDGGALPNVVFYAAAFLTHSPWQLFIAGDAGVWAQIPGGGWFNLSGNLPSVVISDIVYHTKDRTLMAATYGRGLWRLPVATTMMPVAPGIEPDGCLVAFGLRINPTVAAPVQIAPDDGTVVPYSPSEKLSIVTVSVQPIAGALGYLVDFFPAFEGAFSIGTSSLTPDIRVVSPDFRGGKWRVCALMPDGLRSAVSGWRSLSFATAPSSQKPK